MKSLMKRRLSIRGIGYLTLLFCLSATVNPFAQNEPQQSRSEKLSDQIIRFGQLDNGLTYYIRHNETAQNKAEFYLVQKVGSILEENNQLGMTHFIAQMAKKSSKNFPKQRDILSYIESIGMSAGENLHTYTGFDETVYKLMNVPVTRQGIIDSCLLILHDWSSFLLLDEEDIEDARRVIREEWHMHKNTPMRLLEKQLPAMYPESKYGSRLPNSDNGSRLPIGILGIVENFPRHELVDYYKTWFRPDLQAIIIIGDIDVDKIENQIKTVFSDIPKPINPKPREYYFVPDNEIPLISIAKDPEESQTQIQIFYKYEQLPEKIKGSIVDFFENYNKNIISLVMTERFAEIKHQPDPPFHEAHIVIGNYLIAKTKSAWNVTAIVEPNGIEKALQTLVRETRKIKELGITDDEYKRAKEKLHTNYQKAFDERNTIMNSVYGQKYTSHFINRNFIAEIETEYEFINTYINDVPVDVVNSSLRNILKDVGKNKFKNIVISITGKDQNEIKYPKETDVADYLIRANNIDFEENEEEEIDTEIIPVLPQPGKIIEEKQNQLFGTTNYKLSNGATVVIKQTDYKTNEIRMKAMSPGGTSLFKDKNDIWNVKWLNTAIQIGGLGQFSNEQLGKKLSRKAISAEPKISSSSEYLDGSTITRDLKSLFEVIYLYFTEMRKDEEEYKEVKEREITQMKKESVNPEIIFSNIFKGLLYDNNPRDMRLEENDFDKISYDRMIEMYRERFADASDFVFTFVGSIDLDTIKPLIEQYIASLPTKNKKEIPDEHQETLFHKGVIKKHFKQKLTNPQATIELKYSGKMPFNLKNIIITQVLNDIIDKVLWQKLQEDEGAIYNALSSVDLYDFPKGKSAIDIYLVTKPEIYEKTIKIVKDEIQNLANQGPTESYLSNTKRNIKLQMEKFITQNDYWINTISFYYFNQFDGHTRYQEILDSLTIKDIRKFTKELISQGNEIELVMLPE